MGTYCKARGLENERSGECDRNRLASGAAELVGASGSTDVVLISKAL
jgi:hypothetical protein